MVSRGGRNTCIILFTTTRNALFKGFWGVLFENDFPKDRMDLLNEFWAIGESV